MAGHTLAGGPSIDFVDKRRTQAQGSVVGTPANYMTNAALRTRLTAISGTTYSSAQLDKMTTNDMVYALRVNDDAAGI